MHAIRTRAGVTERPSPTPIMAPIQHPKHVARALKRSQLALDGVKVAAGLLVRLGLGLGLE